MTVEVKTTMRVKHVTKFIEDLSKAKERMKEYRNYKIYGAVTLLRSEEKVQKNAENKGLFVIRATGNSAQIINSIGFEPKSF